MTLSFPISHDLPLQTSYNLQSVCAKTPQLMQYHKINEHTTWPEFMTSFTQQHTNWTLMRQTSVLTKGNQWHARRQCPPPLLPVLPWPFLLLPVTFTSSTECRHLTVGLPTCLVPSGVWNVTFLYRYCSCILQRCPSHLNLPALITLDVSEMQCPKAFKNPYQVYLNCVHKIVCVYLYSCSPKWKIPNDPKNCTEIIKLDMYHETVQTPQSHNFSD